MPISADTLSILVSIPWKLSADGNSVSITKAEYDAATDPQRSKLTTHAKNIFDDNGDRPFLGVRIPKPPTADDDKNAIWDAVITVVLERQDRATLAALPWKFGAFGSSEASQLILSAGDITDEMAANATLQPLLREKHYVLTGSEPLYAAVIERHKPLRVLAWHLDAERREFVIADAKVTAEQRPLLTNNPFFIQSAETGHWHVAPSDATLQHYCHTTLTPSTAEELTKLRIALNYAMSPAMSPGADLSDVANLAWYHGTKEGTVLLADREASIPACAHRNKDGWQIDGDAWSSFPYFVRIREAIEVRARRFPEERKEDIALLPWNFRLQEDYKGAATIDKAAITAEQQPLVNELTRYRLIALRDDKYHVTSTEFEKTLAPLFTLWREREIPKIARLPWKGSEYSSELSIEESKFPAAYRESSFFGKMGAAYYITFGPIQTQIRDAARAVINSEKQITADGANLPWQFNFRQHVRDAAFLPDSLTAQQQALVDKLVERQLIAKDGEHYKVISSEFGDALQSKFRGAHAATMNRIAGLPWKVVGSTLFKTIVPSAESGGFRIAAQHLTPDEQASRYFARVDDYCYFERDKHPNLSETIAKTTRAIIAREESAVNAYYDERAKASQAMTTSTTPGKVPVVVQLADDILSYPWEKDREGNFVLYNRDITDQVRDRLDTNLPERCRVRSGNILYKLTVEQDAAYYNQVAHEKALHQHISAKTVTPAQKAVFITVVNGLFEGKLTRPLTPHNLKDCKIALAKTMRLQWPTERDPLPLFMTMLEARMGDTYKQIFPARQNSTVTTTGSPVAARQEQRVRNCAQQ